MLPDISGLDKKGLAYLILVYIIWGSTYMVIRVAVQEGSGLSPFYLGAGRGLVAGILLLLWAHLAGQRLRLTMDEIITLVGSAILLWTIGNGMLLVAIQHIDSGLSALIIASTAVWAALIEALIDKRKPSRHVLISLCICSLGILALSMPTLLDGVSGDIISLLVLVIAAFSWAAGIVLQKRRKAMVSSLVSSGVQLLTGGITFIFMAWVFGDPYPHPTGTAWLALTYLTFIGSIIGFTAFTQAVSLLPVHVASTYGYVNPMIAVFLGWMILGEEITHWTILGSALILWGVSWVFKSHPNNPDKMEIEPTVDSHLPNEYK